MPIIMMIFLQKNVHLHIFQELIARVQQLEAYTFQLKNIIKKSGGKCDPGESHSDEPKNTETKSSRNRPFDFSKYVYNKMHLLLASSYDMTKILSSKS